MKYVVYYRVRGGTKVNRDYPEFSVTSYADVQAAWKTHQYQSGRGDRIYLDHETHADYTMAFASAGLVGADETTVRNWLEQRLRDLSNERMRVAQQAAANRIPANAAPQGAPGTMTVDQHGRRGRVPQVPLEVFRATPIDPNKAWDAVRDFCKGGGGNFPRSGGS
jgi:hypothetical protein